MGMLLKRRIACSRSRKGGVRLAGFPCPGVFKLSGVSGTAMGSGSMDRSHGKVISTFTHMGCSFSRHCLLANAIHNSNSSEFTGNGG